MAYIIRHTKNPDLAWSDYEHAFVHKSTASEYETLDDVPLFITDDGKDLFIEVFSDNPKTGIDVRYYENDQTDEATAIIEEI